MEEQFTVVIEKWQILQQISAKTIQIDAQCYAKLGKGTNIME